MTIDADTLKALADPFDPADVKFKPQAVKGNRALAIAYADVRAVMDRLDEVLGPVGWQDDYEVLPDHSVVCRLTIHVGERSVRKTDVGSPSEQPDGGDRLKAAFSDALKRAAVKFGIGRYLYRLPQQWADYDPAKRCFVQPPRLPSWALPNGAGRADRAAPTNSPPPKKDEPPRPQAGPQANGKTTDIKTGAELLDRLRKRDAELAAEGRARPGELLSHVVAMGVKAGYGAAVEQWPAPAFQLAVTETTLFLSGKPAAPQGPLTAGKRSELFNALWDAGFVWSDPATKKRAGKILQTEIPADMPIGRLIDADADKIIGALKLRAKGPSQEHEANAGAY